MNVTNLTSALIAARHTPQVARAMLDATLDVDDSHELVTELVGNLLSILHTCGHINQPVGMVLDMFSAFPDAIQDSNSNISLMLAEDGKTADSADIEQVFKDMTEGTNRADRVWTYKPVLGPLPIHAVVLEGSGFAPRYLAILNGTADDARSMRDTLAARDGR